MIVSIITVSFNAESTIGNALRSVAMQQDCALEHIIIDGASTDNTLDVIKREGGHVARMISEPDRGIYDAMNKGLRIAQGDIVAFLNADDVYADTRVLSRVVYAMQLDGLDALFGDAEFFGPDGSGRAVRRYRSARFNSTRIAWGWMPAHPALFLHRSVFERFGSFDTDYKIAGDFELVARIFHANTIRYHYLPEVLVRMRTGGVSTGGWRNTLLLNKEVLRACHENGIYTNLLMILSKYPFKILEFLNK